MRKHQWKNSDSSKSQSVFLLANEHTSSPTIIPNQTEMAEIINIDFRIWMAMKIMRFRRKLKWNLKNLRNLVKKHNN